MKLRRALAGLLVVLLLGGLVEPAWATNCSIFRSWSVGDSLTASDLTSSFSTVGVTNMTPSCLGDYSANAAQMQTATDPYAAGAESLATSGAGELERLRFVIRHVMGWTQWYTHAEDINLANRSLRVHLTATTGFKHLFRGELHWASAATRFHLFSVSAADYTAGAAHPESAMILAHVGGTTRFMVSVGGDVHVGSTLALHAAGSLHNAALYRYADPSTGLIFPAGGHVAVTAAGVELARFHGYGMVLAPHAALAFRHATGAAHVTAVSLGAGSQVRLGDTGVGLTVQGAGLTTGANRLVGFNAAGTALEAKVLTGASNFTVSHAAGSITLTSTGGRSLHVFTSSGTFGVPEGITEVTILAVAGGAGGGGGAGGNNAPSAGSGGGGGGSGEGRIIRVAVTAGNTHDVTIGGGGGGGAGAGAGTGATGTAGTDTSVGSLVTVTGGAGGVGGALNEGAAGAGGAAKGGGAAGTGGAAAASAGAAGLSAAGGTGGTGGNSNNGGGGGGGAAGVAPGGAGGNANGGNGTTAAANTGAGGGGGAGTSAGSTGGTGGTGGSGLVVIWW